MYLNLNLQHNMLDDQKNNYDPTYLQKNPKPVQNI